jgi:8-oxo-dGTP pyrophosphatase MutT (NUDIX family)
MEPYCGNCGRNGHIFHQCKLPIMSMGIIAFTKDSMDTFRFLMIRRKNTLGFMDFMRGKYSIYNKEYLLNLLNEMSISEKQDILKNDFHILWKQLWCNHSSQYKNEEESSRDKFDALRLGIMTQTSSYTLADLIEESTTQWEETEWGFPKGRRNIYEKDIECALREFTEETGYVSNEIVENIQPFEEIFMGSNYKSYKHKYYLMYMKNIDFDKINIVDNSEVSKIDWKTYDECLSYIRPYNLEKKRMFEEVYNCLSFCEQ